jgi:hypothetical protein
LLRRDGREDVHRPTRRARLEAPPPGHRREGGAARPQGGTRPRAQTAHGDAGRQGPEAPPRRRLGHAAAGARRVPQESLVTGRAQQAELPRSRRAPPPRLARPGLKVDHAGHGRGEAPRDQGGRRDAWPAFRQCHGQRGHGRAAHALELPGRPRRGNAREPDAPAQAQLVQRAAPGSAASGPSSYRRSTRRYAG